MKRQILPLKGEVARRAGGGSVLRGDEDPTFPRKTPAKAGAQVFYRRAPWLQKSLGPRFRGDCTDLWIGRG